MVNNLTTFVKKMLDFDDDMLYPFLVKELTTPNIRGGGGHMKEKNLQLCSLIHGQFKSESAFADRLGWPRQKLHKILTGTQKPTLVDVNTIAEGLGVPFMMICNIFLHWESTN